MVPSTFSIQYLRISDVKVHPTFQAARSAPGLLGYKMDELFYGSREILLEAFIAVVIGLSLMHGHVSGLGASWPHESNLLMFYVTICGTECSL